MHHPIHFMFIISNLQVYINSYVLTTIVNLYKLTTSQCACANNSSDQQGLED